MYVLSMHKTNKMRNGLACKNKVCQNLLLCSFICMINIKNQHGQNLTVIWYMKYKNKVCQNLLLCSFICMKNVKNSAKKTYDKASI